VKSLLDYTELAMSLVGGKLPSIAYLPPAIRGRRARMTTEGISTEHPQSVEEQVTRIVHADPLGFLIAMMHGQPVVTFRVGASKRHENAQRRRKADAEVPIDTTPDGVEVFAEYHSPTIPDRERIAIFLAERIPTIAKEKKKGGRSKPEEQEPAEDTFGKLLDDRSAKAD
jgi:hypothetical protein